MMWAVAVSMLLVFQAMAVSPKKGKAVKHQELPTPENFAIKTKEEEKIGHIFGKSKEVQHDEEEAEEGMHVMKSKDRLTTVKRKQLRRRLLNKLDAGAGTAGADEVQKLSSVFHDDNRVPMKHHHKDRHHMARAERTAEKLSHRRISRYEDPGQCGAHKSVDQLGIRRGAEAARLFNKPSLLQSSEPEEEEEGWPASVAQPGVGANQTKADNGRDKMGSVNGETPFLTVYKDGFWPVGCFKDAMFHYGDKFGTGKHRYKKDFVNISVAVYSDLVLEDKQMPMTPRVCFEFCRTFEGMVYFGLMGTTCYCTPYYEMTAEGVGDADGCDLACPGDDLTICGGLKKASIFEMHLCGDRGEQLALQAEKSGRILSSFYATALFAGEAGRDLQASGALLEEVASLGGDPDSAGLGREAKRWAGELELAIIDGNCLDLYNTLLMGYEEGEVVAFSNLKIPGNIQKADATTDLLVATTPKVEKCNKEYNKEVEKGYPTFADALDATSDKDWLKLEEHYGSASMVFAPLPYALKSTEDPHMSSCFGEMIGKPMTGTFAECSQACDQMVHPEACVAFQFFHMGGSEPDAGGAQGLMQPLCFMYKKIKSVVKYECALDETITKDYQTHLDDNKKEEKLFLQLKKNQLDKTIDPEEEEEGGDLSKIEEPQCDQVGRFLLYTSLTCDELFGPDSSVKKTCKVECDRMYSALLSATCFIKVSEVVASMPNPDMEVKKRCFGGARNKEIQNAKGAEIYFLPFDEQGVILSGDAEVGTSTVLEPIIWTVSEED